MKRSAAILIPGILALPAPLAAELVEDTRALFLLPSSITQVGLATFSGGLAGDTASRVYSGNFVATFGFDRETLELASFQFDGGEILTSGYTLQFTDTVLYPPPIGSGFTYILREPHPDFPPSYMRFSPRTLGIADGAVLPDGTLDNSHHYLYADRGSQVTARTVSNASIGSSIQPPVLVNYTFSPAALPFKGVATPTLGEISSTLHQRSLQLTLVIEFNEADTTVLPGVIAALNLPVLETEHGTVTAQSGFFPVATDYGSWASDNGLVQPDPEDTNDAGIAYGILYALDLPADSTSLPIDIASTPEGPVASIVLPEGGLRHPMGVESTMDLTAADWPELPADQYLDGADSLDRGATGEPRFSFPPGTTGHLRFTTTLE